MGKAVRGAGWTILTGVGARALGLVGTLWLTYFLDPDVQGSVSNAFILAVTAHQVSSLGIAQYLVANPRSGKEIAWNVTVVQMLIGIVFFAALILSRDAFGGMLNAPTMAQYIPGCALAMFLERFGVVPERLLARQLKFRIIGFGRMVGEVTYTVVSVGLAWLHFGGMAIVWGNVARSALYLVIVMSNVDRRDWLTPSPLSMKQMRPVFSYGIQLWIGALATFASRRWDNLVVSHYYGEATVGEYNLAYNLADIPAVQVGEQIGDVLFPSFSQMEAGERKKALLRSTGLLALIVFPLAVGLGVLAPTVVAALLRKEWAGVGPMLMILAALSVVRPVGWTVQSYLQASNRPRATMILGVCKIAFLLGILIIIGRLSPNPLLACGAVGLAFGLHSLASMWTVARWDQISILGFLGRCAGPLAATIPMVLVVLGVRHLVGTAIPVRVELVLELLVGAVTYIGSALTIARSTAQDFLGLVKGAIARRRGRASSPSIP